MPKRWLVKRRLLVVLEVYTTIYGQQQFGKCWCVAQSQPTLEKVFVVNYYSCKIFSYVFGVPYENIFTTKIKRIMVYHTEMAFLSYRQQI